MGAIGEQRQSQRGGFGGASTSSAAGRGGGVAAAPGAGGYGQVSDGIVQYQKNVALLEKMARNVGTKHDSVSQTQFNLQLDVIRQLGQRIGTQLKSHESQLSSLPRAEASRSRATYVKLSRDYRTVEQQFRNVQLDVQRKRGLAEARRREAEEEGRRSRDAGEENEEVMMRQMQIQEDRINEEIMREREEEIKNIHKGMHQVNEIYKDLAHLVDNQQEDVDTIETQMESANANASAGLKHIEKANESSQSSQCVIS